MKMNRLHIRIWTIAASAGLTGLSKGAPPVWWSNGTPPAVDSAAAANNRGPSNHGQAKWMASEALRALAGVDQDLANSVRDLLVLPQPNPSGGTFPAILDFSIPDPKTASWLQSQKAPLLIGQLKAVSAPFYQQIHACAPVWLNSQLVANLTKDAADPANFYPWTSAVGDDLNKGVATIGQLKSVFSLRFEADTDTNGFPDLWEYKYFGDLGVDPDADPDFDGLTNLQEFQAGSNPNDNGGTALDVDGDGWLDSDELLGGGTTSIKDNPKVLLSISVE